MRISIIIVGSKGKKNEGYPQGHIIFPNALSFVSASSFSPFLLRETASYRYNKLKKRNDLAKTYLHTSWENLKIVQKGGRYFDDTECSEGG